TSRRSVLGWRHTQRNLPPRRRHFLEQCQAPARQQGRFHVAPKQRARTTSNDDEKAHLAQSLIADRDIRNHLRTSSMRDERQWHRTETPPMHEGRRTPVTTLFRLVDIPTIWGAMLSRTGKDRRVRDSPLNTMRSIVYTFLVD